MSNPEEPDSESNDGSLRSFSLSSVLSYLFPSSSNDLPPQFRPVWDEQVNAITQQVSQITSNSNDPSSGFRLDVLGKSSKRLTYIAFMESLSKTELVYPLKTCVVAIIKILTNTALHITLDDFQHILVSLFHIIQTFTVSFFDVLSQAPGTEEDVIFSYFERYLFAKLHATLVGVYERLFPFQHIHEVGEDTSATDPHPHSAETASHGVVACPCVSETGSGAAMPPTQTHSGEMLEQNDTLLLVNRDHENNHDKTSLPPHNASISWPQSSPPTSVLLDESFWCNHSVDPFHASLACRKLTVLSWLCQFPSLLDLPYSLYYPDILILAAAELIRMRSYKAAHDKMICLFRSCRILFVFQTKLSQLTKQSFAGADTYVPLLVCALLFSHYPPCQSKIAQYLQQPPNDHDNIIFNDDNTMLQSIIMSQPRPGDHFCPSLSSLHGTPSSLEEQTETRPFHSAENKNNTIEQAYDGRISFYHAHQTSLTSDFTPHAHSSSAEHHFCTSTCFAYDLLLLSNYSQKTGENEYYVTLFHSALAFICDMNPFQHVQTMLIGTTSNGNRNDLEKHGPQSDVAALTDGIQLHPPSPHPQQHPSDPTTSSLLCSRVYSLVQLYDCFWWRQPFIQTQLAAVAVHHQSGHATNTYSHASSRRNQHQQSKDTPQRNKTQQDRNNQPHMQSNAHSERIPSTPDPLLTQSAPSSPTTSLPTPKNTGALASSSKVASAPTLMGARSLSSESISAALQSLLSLPDATGGASAPTDTRAPEELTPDQLLHIIEHSVKLHLSGSAPPSLFAQHSARAGDHPTREFLEQTHIELNKVNDTTISTSDGGETPATPPGELLYTEYLRHDRFLVRILYLLQQFHYHQTSGTNPSS